MSPFAGNERFIGDVGKSEAAVLNHRDELLDGLRPDAELVLPDAGPIFAVAVQREVRDADIVRHSPTGFAQPSDNSAVMAQNDVGFCFVEPAMKQRGIEGVVINQWGNLFAVRDAGLEVTKPGEVGMVRPPVLLAVEEQADAAVADASQHL